MCDLMEDIFNTTAKHSTKRMNPDLRQVGITTNATLPAITRNGLSED